MNPITFRRSKLIQSRPAQIAAQIADTARWSDFPGYAFLPGIERAEYETQTAQMVGSRIRVQNRDGSQHVEEITVWQPDSRIVMKLHDFTPPLNRLATHFVEEWRFEPQNGATHITRTISMHPTGPLTRPFLWLISLLFRRAIAAHLQSIVP